MMKQLVLMTGLLIAGVGGIRTTGAAEVLRVFSVTADGYVMTEKVVRGDEEWRSTLSERAFHILREKGTEMAFTGKLTDNHEHGVYRCAGCGLDLFHADEKFDSGSGWPSFTAPVARENIATEIDRSLILRRIEVLCVRCGGHLGHVFSDGPEPTGLRYCINSAALTFEAL